MSSEHPSTEQVETSRPSGSGRIWAFIRIMNVRLRFIFLMVLVGVVAANWERLQNYYDRWQRPAETPESVLAQEIEYYCAMHPNVVRTQPGNCPICGMPLVKRAKTSRKPLSEGILAEVQLSPQKVQMGRIATSPVEYRLLSREVRTVGIVEYDETRRAFVAARIKGRLDKLFVNYVGQRVKQGMPLASIYSPDLLVAQEELLTAVKQMKEEPGRGDLAAGVGKSLVDAAKRKLTLWGITQQQLDEIIKRGTAETHLNIFSPIEGIVTEKKVLEGHYVAEGDDLYTIADLGRVWMQAKIFEDQISGVGIGTAVAVTSVAYPNEIFAGQITFIAYTVDPATRTLAARVEINNSEFKLRPGMYATATIRLPTGRVSPVAASAPAHASDSVTDGLAGAYTSLIDLLAKDKTDAEVVTQIGHEAQALSQKADEPIKSLATQIAAMAKQMTGADLKTQRDTLKLVSAKIIELLRANPPAHATLFVMHCPMAEADWLQISEQVANPYLGSEMPRCGTVTGKILAGPGRQSGEFAEGYFCPIYPDRLFDKPAECPIDKFPMKFVRVEKVLAVPATAVINTGARRVVYRESGPGTYDMLEVQVGPKAGDYFPVVSGVKAGDRVATAGAFVVDAENRLNPAAGAQFFGAGGGASGGDQPKHQHGG